MTTALAKGITLDGGAFALAVEVNDDSSDIALETVGSAFKAAALGVARGDSTYFLGKLPDASTQRITFTPSASDTCEWEIELVQLNEDGRKVPPRRGVFTVATTVNMGDVFTADDLVGYPGETFAFLRIYRVEQPPLAGQTLVASATMTVGAINPATARAWPTSAAGSGDLGDGAYDTIAVAGATIPAGYVAAFGGPVQVAGKVNLSSAPTALTDSAIHVANSATTNTLQSMMITLRAYNAAQKIGGLRLESGSGFSYLELGRGSSALGVESPQHGILYTQATPGTPSDGVRRLWWHVNGVTVGINAPNPTSGRAFAAHTTAHGATPSLVVKDDGWVHCPNDSSGLKIGAGDDLRLYHDGAWSYIRNYTGIYTLYQSVNASFIIRCADAAGGDLIIQTRGSTERARFNGWPGINFPASSAVATVSSNGQLFPETGTDDLVWKAPSGVEYRLSMTAV